MALHCSYTSQHLGKPTHLQCSMCWQTSAGHNTNIWELAGDEGSCDMLCYTSSNKGHIIATEFMPFRAADTKLKGMYLQQIYNYDSQANIPLNSLTDMSEFIHNQFEK